MLELIRGGGRGRILNRTVAFIKKIPFLIFWVCLQLCRFFDFEFIEKFHQTFLQNPSGGIRTLNRTFGFEKKIPSKFFGYVYNTVVSWILSLSKNITRFFPRTHPGGGTRTLNRTTAFNKKIPFEIFCVCLMLCSFFDFDFIEKFYQTSLQNSSGGDQNSQENFWF